MEHIKMFLASSAELDQDKTVFDLFISEKNKVYRKRYIDFELRTWKDFVSAMTLGRLQDNYNEYIKTCDIVIFLFHTRLGQYTVEEFEIAHRQFLKTNGKKPKIYVYFKTSEQLIPELETFKERNVQDGHFYDTYSSDEELLRKFDRQLQELENEGLIKPNPIDIKKIFKYAVLYFLLPLLTLTLGYFALDRFTTLNMTVKVNETKQIASMPFQSGEVTLIYADKTESQSISKEVIFKQIAAKYKGDKARIIFRAKGYNTIDTTIMLSKMIELPIVRDNSLGKIFGSIKDEDNRPLAGVNVSVQDISVTSDDLGRFTIDIPFEKQFEEQRLTAYKEGYQLWDFTAEPSQTVEWKIILKK